METNYITKDGTEIYVNEEQICLAIVDPEDLDYTIITMSCGERLSVKSKESTKINDIK